MADKNGGGRRSMVGAPPSSHPLRTPASKVAPKGASRSTTTTKRKAEEEVEVSTQSESDDNDTKEDDASDMGDDDDANTDAGKTPQPKKRKRKRMDTSMKAKRRAEKRAAEVEKKKKEDPEDVVEEKEKSPESDEEPEPIIKEPSLNRYSPFQLLIDHLLRKLMEKDPEEYFHFPVTSTIAPDYAAIIKTPMDFHTMREKIEANLYTSIPEFRGDARLVGTNALRYNAPNTVYHVAADRLIQVAEYYTSEPYLRYCQQNLPFSASIDWDDIGMGAAAASTTDRPDGTAEDKAIGKQVTAEEIIKSVNAKMRERLSKRRGPLPELAFLKASEDGTTTLNVLGETTATKAKLINLVGRLDEGTPGMFAPSDNKILGHAPISYLNYGPFCSFAPQFDSTWATMRKADSDLLYRTYGDKECSANMLSVRAMVADTANHYINMVDQLLDSLTDGEHTRTIKTLESDFVIKEEKITDWAAHLQDVESLSNVGLDVSWVEDLRRQLTVPVQTDPASRLASTSQALSDLHHLQHQRLSQQPPLTLSRQAPPSQMETELAAKTQEMLVQQMGQVEPQQIVSSAAIQESMGGDLDMDILSEFFVA